MAADTFTENKAPAFSRAAAAEVDSPLDGIPEYVAELVPVSAGSTTRPAAACPFLKIEDDDWAALRLYLEEGEGDGGELFAAAEGVGSFLRAHTEEANPDFWADVGVLVADVCAVRSGRGERLAFVGALLSLATVRLDVARLVVEALPDLASFKHVVLVHGAATEMSRRAAGAEFRGAMDGLADTCASVFEVALRSDGAALLENAEASVSLAGKWAPSENSAENSRWGLGSVLASRLTPAAGDATDDADVQARRERFSLMRYRGLLSACRRAMRVVERDMSSNSWSEIDPARIPSKAVHKYRKAFLKGGEDGRDALRAKFEDAIQSRKIKGADSDIGALVQSLIGSGDGHLRGDDPAIADLAEAQADSLIRALRKDIARAWHERNAEGPEEEEEEEEEAAADADAFDESQLPSVVCMVDVSGSMFSGGSVGPIHYSIGLGLALSSPLLAGDSPWRRRVLTFHERPSWAELPDEFVTAVEVVRHIDWGGSTNFHAALELVLDTCLEQRVEPPQFLVVFTDMHFDAAAHGGDHDDPAGTQVRAKFRDAGLEPPTIVLWNLADPGRTVFQAKADTEGVMLLSGASPRLFVDFLADRHTVPQARNPAFTLFKRLRSEPYQTLWQRIHSLHHADV